MNAVFTDEQRLFQRTVREFLEKECTPESVREGTWSFGRWRRLAELGVVGLLAPESAGGLAKDETDLMLLLEEAGRAALPEPLAETAGVAMPLLVEGGGHGGHVARIARGDVIASFADGRLVLTGESTPSDVLDVGTIPIDRGAFATAAVLCGIAERVIEMAASYAKERHQFGKPIGSFQAVKHLLADALLGLDFARPAVYRAASSLAIDAPDVKRDVSIAKARASDAAVNACRAALQVHGAIGYTHEHDLHLWLTKGFALARKWGTAAWHRERVARSILDGRHV